MRTKKFLYNILSNLLSQIALFAFGIVFPKLIIGRYGSTINGIISVSGQVVGYFTYIEAGISSAAIYLLIRYLASRDTKNTNALLSKNFRLYLGFGACYFVVLLLFSLLYPLCVDLGSFSRLDTFLLIFVICLAGFFDFITLGRYRVLLTADQRGYVISFSSLAAYIVCASLSILFIYLGFNIIWVKFPLIFQSFLRSGFLYFYVKRKYPEVSFSSHEPYKMPRFANGDATLFQISRNISVTLPIVLISFFSLTNASVFSVYNSIFSGITGIIAIFTSGSSSSFGDVIVRKQEDILKTSFRIFEFGIFLIMGYLFSITIVTLNSFIENYTRNFDVRYADSLLAILLVAWGMFQNSRIPYATLINASGKYDKMRLASIGQIVLLFVLGPVLTIYFGEYGMAWAMIASSAFGLFFVMLQSYRFVYHFSLKSFFLHFIACLVCIISSYFLSTISVFSYTPTDLWRWFLFAFVVALIEIPLCLLVFIVFDFSSAKLSFNKLKEFIKARKGPSK
jgi:hypothetical protein